MTQTTPNESPKSPVLVATEAITDSFESLLGWVARVVTIAVGVFLGLLLFVWVAGNYLQGHFDQFKTTFPTETYTPTTTTTP